MNAKEECEILLDALLSSSEKLLKKNGEFYPVGAVLFNDDNVKFTALQFEDDFPDSKSVINDLICAHKQLAQNNEIKVSGISWNGTVDLEGKTTDAVIVSLEHKDDYSVIVGLPYKIGLFKKIKFGELFAQNGNTDIFKKI